MAIDYSTGERVGRLSAKEAWETIEDLAQYEDEEWYNLIFPEKGNLEYIDATSEQVLENIKCQVESLMRSEVLLFAMSSDNASSTVTYTSVSSDSNGPSSWGIPLVNAGEIPVMDPYEEVAQQGQAHPLSPAYVPDLMELDEHVEDQPYADDASPTAELPRYIADSDSMEEDTNADSIDYPDEPKDGEEDDDEEHEEDPSEDHEPEDDDDDDDDTDDEDEEPTEDEEEEEHLAPADSSVVPVVDHVLSAGDTEAFETDESAPTPRSPQTRVPFS
ncbi:hypothetical protein Tco_0656530 [Tanacetum coccineum]|uniref:Uncharacterized protein n=1 Tax=Tanacetum coccineum TaxID=301880 RepID=A0ABQ4X983_9ASTR